MAGLQCVGEFLARRPGRVVADDDLAAEHEAGNGEGLGAERLRRLVVEPGIAAVILHRVTPDLEPRIPGLEFGDERLGRLAMWTGGRKEVVQPDGGRAVGGGAVPEVVGPGVAGVSPGQAGQTKQYQQPGQPDHGHAGKTCNSESARILAGPPADSLRSSTDAGSATASP